MSGIGHLLLAGLLQVPPVVTNPGSIDSYLTYEAVLEQGAAAATAQWTAQCVAGGEFADLASSYAPDTRTGIDERKAQAARFDPREFERIATDAWRTVDAALPQGPMRICVDLAPVGDTFTRDRMGGIAGVTAGKGRIILRIHPEANWRSALPYVIAHEMHHSYWAQHHYDPAKPFTLADYMVLEGRADYFAGTLFTHAAPWTSALDAAAYATAWQALSKALNSTDWGILQAAMFGAPQAGIPPWAGYSIGYRLVSERMARSPKLDVKAMTASPASEFVSPSSAGR